MGKICMHLCIGPTDSQGSSFDDADDDDMF